MRENHKIGRESPLNSGVDIWDGNPDRIKSNLMKINERGRKITEALIRARNWKWKHLYLEEIKKEMDWLNFITHETSVWAKNMVKKCEELENDNGV